MPASSIVFVRPGCPYCARAREALRRAGIESTEIALDAAVDDLRALLAIAAPHVQPSEVTGRYPAPQVFIRAHRRGQIEYVGGADDLDRRLTPTGTR